MKLLVAFVFLIIINPLAKAGVGEVLRYRDNRNDFGDLHGWDGPLELLKEELDYGKNYAVFVIHKPHNAFILKDIHMFRNTVRAKRHALEATDIPALGHVQIGWACYYPGRENNGRYYGFTGQSGEHHGQGSSMLLDGNYGMSLFFANFTDGNLESASYSANRLNQSDDFIWLAVEISQRDCTQGVDYLNTYIANKAYKNFSFYLDPRRYQGGGCTSFGAVFAEKLGAFSEGLVNAWNRTFRIPKSFVGNPDGNQFSKDSELPHWVSRENMPRPNESLLPQETQLPYWLWGDDYRNNRAGKGKLFLTPFPGISGNLITRVYDPELMILSIQAIGRRYASMGARFPESFDIYYRKAYGLERDEINGRPKGASNRSYVLLDENLNHFPIMKSINDYIWNSQINPPGVKMGRIGNVWGLILNKKTW